jgi:hypothetical protein
LQLDLVADHRGAEWLNERLSNPAFAPLLPAPTKNGSMVEPFPTKVASSFCITFRQLGENVQCRFAGPPPASLFDLFFATPFRVGPSARTWKRYAHSAGRGGEQESK